VICFRCGNSVGSELRRRSQVELSKNACPVLSDGEFRYLQSVSDPLAIHRPADQGEHFSFPHGEARHPTTLDRTMSVI
jgi:hypothetical protein